MKRNDWQARFGASRRARDRAYCAEAERAIAAEIQYGKPEVVSRNEYKVSEELRHNIARAFGRPIH